MRCEIKSPAPPVEPVETTGPSVELVETTGPSVELVETTGPSVELVETTVPSVELVETTVPSVELVETTVPSVELVETTGMVCAHPTGFLDASPGPSLRSDPGRHSSTSSAYDRSSAPVGPQTFWIWLKLSSTGVSRPKISTSALTRWASALISVIVACSVANGPSTTITESDSAKSATSTGFLAAVVAEPLEAAEPAADSAWAIAAGASMFSTSAMLSGTGWWGLADEPGHRRGVADGRPRLVGEVHPHEHVARQDGPLDHLALTVLDLRDLFGGDHDLVDVVLHVEGDDAVLEVGADAVLHAVVGVDDVPLARLGPQLATEHLERVVLVGLLGLGVRVEGLLDRVVDGGLLDGVVGRLGDVSGHLGLFDLFDLLGLLDRFDLLGRHRLVDGVERLGGGFLRRGVLLDV